MSAPDPKHMRTFCHDQLVSFLDESGVYVAVAGEVGADVFGRAQDFSALDRSTQDVLIAPFVEEAAHHLPETSPVRLKAAVTVVVRNSSLEDVHASGPIESRHLRVITEMAAGPLSHLLAARNREQVEVSPANQFALLPAEYPRAWCALSELAQVMTDGGRASYRLPARTPLTLPDAAQRITARTATDSGQTTILSGIDPRFDQNLMATLDGVANGDIEMSWVPKLSHYSRSFSKLLWILEFILSHDATVLTTNYLLRPKDVWVRRKLFVKPTELDPRSAYTDLTGLSGAHRQTVQSLLQQLKE